MNNIINFNQRKREKHKAANLNKSCEQLMSESNRLLDRHIKRLGKLKDYIESPRFEWSKL